jgi:tetratricopeptide (TPR) repeat protein
MKNLAGTYEQDGRLADAEKLFSPTLEIQRKVLGPAHPEAAITTSNLAALYQLEGKYERAEETRRRAVQARPDDPGSLINLAWLLVATADHWVRRPVEALELARRTAKLAPGNANDMNTVGLVEVRNGRWDEAIETLKRCVALHKESDASDFLFLAMAYQGRGDKVEAERSLARGAELASKTAADNTELRMLGSEAAEALGKPGPVPTLPEVKAEPDRAMEWLKRMAAAGLLKPETLETGADLVPLRERPREAGSFGGQSRSLRRGKYAFSPVWCA